MERAKFKQYLKIGLILKDVFLWSSTCYAAQNYISSNYLNVKPSAIEIAVQRNFDLTGHRGTKAARPVYAIKDEDITSQLFGHMKTR